MKMSHLAACKRDCWLFGFYRFVMDVKDEVENAYGI